jgi:3-hydroxyisobutyrate dehydrogenase-like beta-hydroxyacid dehydrogenase
MKEVAFIGLGSMGAGIARNLIKAGFKVRVFDLAEKAIAASPYPRRMPQSAPMRRCA